MSSLVQVDGSLGEGGGQVLRVALCLSGLYKIPLEINNIRAGRPKPGLAAQHLKGVELMAEMCNAQVNGAYIGSKRLEFRPGSFNKSKRTYIADTQTAGCICLLAQVALPCALFFPDDNEVILILKGGTNVPMGPHIEYLTEVLKPMLNKFGADFDNIVARRGYYPKGGGWVRLCIKPIRNLNAVTLTDPGVPCGISGWAYRTGNTPKVYPRKMSDDAKAVLTEGLTKQNVHVPPIDIEVYREDWAMAVGEGSGINIVCNTTTGCVFGGSGLALKQQEEPAPGVVAANQILDPILAGSCVDEHMQDQMIIFMALAKGTSRIKVGSKKLTCHTETAIQVAEQMLGSRGLRFKLCENAEGGDTAGYVLQCEGCGLANENFGSE